MPKFKIRVMWEADVVLHANDEDDARGVWMDMSYDECLETMRNSKLGIYEDVEVLHEED